MTRFSNDGRYTSMVLFDVFQDAMKDCISGDSYLFSRKQAKAAIAHSLAVHMHHRLRERLSLSLDTESPLYLTLPGNLVFDILLDKTDIVLHDRKGRCVMRIMLYNDYLSKKAGEMLRKQSSPNQLTLGVSFLPGKPYLLIYHINRETIDYYHYDLTENSTRLRMKRDREESGGDGQLPLLKTRRKRKAKKAEETSAQE